MTPVELDTVMQRFDSLMEIMHAKLTTSKYQTWGGLFGKYGYTDSLAVIDSLERNADGRITPQMVHGLFSQGRPKNDDGSSIVEYRGSDPLTRESLKLDETNPKQANTEISTAWMIYQNKAHPTIFKWTVESDMTFQTAVEFVNKECARMNLPECLPPEYRIESFYNQQQEEVF